jgi:putative membrane protein
MSTVDRRASASKSVLQKCSAVAAAASLVVATAWPVHAQTGGGAGGAAGTGTSTGTGAGAGAATGGNTGTGMGTGTGAGAATGTGTGTGSGTGMGTGAAAGMATGGAATGTAGSRMGASGATGNSAVAAVDRSIMEDMAHSNLGEIEAGKLALEKSQSAEVKKYAQQMIDDHTKAQGELQQLAQKKGVTLPDGPGPVNVTKVTAMKALTGNTFDSQYMKRAGVGDHEGTLKLLQKTQKEGRDPELKAMAAKMTPVVQKHLKMAQGMPMAK